MHEQARYRDEEILSRLKTIQAHVSLQRQGSFGGETLQDFEPEEAAVSPLSPEGWSDLISYTSASAPRASEYVNHASSPVGQYSASVRSPSFAAISPRTSLSTSTGMTMEDETSRLSLTSPPSLDRKELESAVRAGRADKVKDIVGRAGGDATVSDARTVCSPSRTAC